MQARVRKEGDFLKLEFLHGQAPQTVILVPERADGPEPRFFTYQEGLRLPVQFHCTAEGVELVYERYKLKRTGGLALGK